jgi:hypothetical protein
MRRDELLLPSSAPTQHAAPLPVVYITRPLLDRTAALVASFAEEEPREGVVYWFGCELGARAIVTTLIVPDADTSGGDVVTSAAANAEALTAIVDTPLVLLGQAHSHPGGHVFHSPVDDRETFAQFPGALSVVIPYFGWYGTDLTRCGVHRHLDGAFRRVPSDSVAEHLVVLPGERDFRRAGAPGEAHGDSARSYDSSSRRRA